MVIIALGNGHYDLKILRSLFDSSEPKKNFRATVGSLAPKCPPLCFGVCPSNLPVNFAVA